MTTTLLIAAVCLLDEHGRLLLVRKRATRAFMLPGGKLEAGESPEAALRRELREELDLSLDEQPLQALGRFLAPAANEANTRIDAHIFIARLPHPVSPAAELEELRWHDADGPPSDDLAPLLLEHVLPALARQRAH
ncbi:NUDIX hydrolase [Aquipseudomonas ullengensis]|uniref:NUDIX domain-containing protein n=1 Tax=Aquipseudomonas ullengensis TaxID=2759166 RepID=A0A7W4QDR7_9GAMM|nr:NUDIX domain-containing protein [Pseudomonas ullengensis]MBB2494838.1 NUDIX domain-containing protein [Pseudomonas ullengensis]